MIHRRTLVAAVVALIAALLAPSALAAKAPQRYSPQHGAKCHKGYKRVAKHQRQRRLAKHHGNRKAKIFCVKRKHRQKPVVVTPTAAAGSPSPLASSSKRIKLRAHLDPRYTRDPLNPFKVTFAYSATAGQQEVTANSFAPLSVEEPAPLPEGVLALYSDGKLECASNVGGDVDEGECPVAYKALGQHTITTIYTSGDQSAAVTEVENITPLPTETELALSYQDKPDGPFAIKESAVCKEFPTGPSSHEDRCNYDYEWVLGTLTVEGGSTLGPTGISCPSCQSLFGSTTLNGTLSAPVILKATAFIRWNGPAHPSCEELRSIVMNPNAEETKWSFPTSLAVSATSGASGYETSQANASLAFAPTLPC